VDDRRVISGIVHVLKIGAGGGLGRRSMVRTPRSTTGLCDGRNAEFGKAFSCGRGARPIDPHADDLLNPCQGPSFSLGW